MKRGVMLMGFGLLFLAGFSPVLSAQEAGRYQLEQVKYTHSDWDTGATSEQNEVFLLDTSTGDVQVYVSGTTKGKQLKYWAPALVDETEKKMGF